MQKICGTGKCAFLKAGSWIRFKNSDLQDPEPTKNGPDPQPCPKWPLAVARDHLRP